MKEQDVVKLIESVGGEVKTLGRLPDGSGFATASFPAAKDHWSVVDGYNVPPMVLRCGTDEGFTPSALCHLNKLPEIIRRDDLVKIIREAGKYAVRASTMNGKEMDFDPDAMLQNLVVGFLGYWTNDGLSNDEFENPKFGR